MYRRSLRKRIAIAFAICVAVLSVVWGFAFFAAIRLTEDHVLQKQLQHAAENYPSLTTNLRGYEDIGSLPPSLREWAQTNPDEGLYEFEAEELHVPGSSLRHRTIGGGCSSSPVSWVFLERLVSG
jgi:hypothetical protein